MFYFCIHCKLFLFQVQRPRVITIPTGALSKNALKRSSLRYKDISACLRSVISRLPKMAPVTAPSSSAFFDVMGQVLPGSFGAHRLSPLPSSWWQRQRLLHRVSFVITWTERNIDVIRGIQQRTLGQPTGITQGTLQLYHILVTAY